MAPEQLEAFSKVPGLLKWFKSPEQGAATTILAAIGKDYHNKGGIYLEDCGEWGLNANPSMTPGQRGHVAHAFDPEKEAQLWSESSKIVGVEE